MRAMGVPIPRVTSMERYTDFVGSNAKKTLKLTIPLFVSDMSFGTLSEEAKIALVKGTELVRDFPIGFKARIIHYSLSIFRKIINFSKLCFFCNGFR